MITQQAQIKLNISITLKDYLESKARKFGLPVAGYVKHLILKDVEEMECPIFRMSERSEKRLEEAMKHRDKAVDASVFFKKINNER